VCALKCEREGREEGGGGREGGGREGGRESESESERDSDLLCTLKCARRLNPSIRCTHPAPNQHSAFSLKPKAYAERMRRWIHTYKSACSIQPKA